MTDVGLNGGQIGNKIFTLKFVHDRELFVLLGEVYAHYRYDFWATFRSLAAILLPVFYITGPHDVVVVVCVDVELF